MRLLDRSGEFSIVGTRSVSQRSRRSVSALFGPVFPRVKRRTVLSRDVMAAKLNQSDDKLNTVDLPGLKTLTVIHDAVEMVRARLGSLRHPQTGVGYDAIDDVPLDDLAVYHMLSRGGTSGVFQFESNLAQDKLRAMKCDRFEDLV